MTLAIRCSNLQKRYPGRPPVDAVRGLDLEVQEGECFGLLGPNGAGKTTTIEILEGLLKPTSGEVEILGYRWGQRDAELRQLLGISLQETKLPERHTVREILTLFRSFYRRGISATELMRLMDLDPKANAWTMHLSGGQRQRLAVACALVGDPRLLFLDEPTTGLDPQSRRQLWDIIRQFRALGRTILLTTHYMDEAERLCDRVAIVDQGRVIACDTPRRLIASLGGEHVVEFSFEDHATLDEASRQQVLEWPTVRTLREEADHVCLTVGEPHRALPELLAWVDRHDRRLASLTTRHLSLEDVFVTLTGRHLREAEEQAA